MLSTNIFVYHHNRANNKPNDIKTWRFHVKIIYTSYKNSQNNLHLILQQHAPQDPRSNDTTCERYELKAAQVLICRSSRWATLYMTRYFVWPGQIVSYQTHLAPITFKTKKESKSHVRPYNFLSQLYDCCECWIKIFYKLKLYPGHTCHSIDKYII